MARNALLIGLVLAGLTATGAALADSKAQVTATGNLAVHDGPGSHYAVIARLKSGAKFNLRERTREHGWCLVVDKNKDAIGWVRADDLRGFPAKIQVTPWEPLFNPFRDDRLGHRDDDDDDMMP